MEVLSLPLTLTVTCRGSDRASAVRHPVVIGADWSFETGHDEGLEAIAAALRPGQLVVLESTTYPGTTRDLVEPILARGGLVPGRDFLVAWTLQFYRLQHPQSEF